MVHPEGHLTFFGGVKNWLHMAAGGQNGWNPEKCFLTDVISAHLWVCCARSRRGKGSRGRAWGRWGRRTLACSPRSSSPWAGASSWTRARASPAAQSPCSTGRCLARRVRIKGNTHSGTSPIHTQHTHSHTYNWNTVIFKWTDGPQSRF